MLGGSSEFYTLTLSTTPLPLDLGDAIQVAMSCSTNNVRIQNHNNTADGNYFLLPKLDGATGNGPMLTTLSCDKRLYVRADSGAAQLNVWVVK